VTTRSEYEADFGSRLVRPVDGHFSNPVAAALSYVEEFQVKAIPVDAGYSKEILGYGSFKELESALGVCNSGDAACLYDPIEDPAKEAPMPPGIDCKFRSA
jgi:hypothetical protein